MKRLLTVLLLITLTFGMRLFAQEEGEDRNELVQFSGVVVTADSLRPLPFTHIIVKGTRRGTISDYFGFFSFVAEKGDIIVFSSLGFKNAYYRIPDTLSGHRYSLIQVMQKDTIMLSETVIYPWPSPSQFKEAFLKLDPPTDDYDRAMNNLTLAELKERGENMPMDGSMNYRNYIQNVSNQLYYAGQLPPNNLLNPIAWSKFIKAWQNGDFTRKKDTETEYYYNEPLE
ncbi:MAG: hypothetical protein C0592_14255 [Marinilabiliales bacterium]|nr:MAG: hypothetical protein C0592_14255 [Marinilabiliales bacterium]